MTRARLRVAVVADMVEEGWPSMDLVAEMLMKHLDGPVTPVLLRPALRRRLGLIAANGRAGTIDRVVNRFLDYPRWLRSQRHTADVFHIVDHSYAHLVNELPAGRVVVTCHDTDAFRSVIDGDRASRLPRRLVRRIADGLRNAAMVACVSERTRRDLVAAALVPVERTEVIPNGVHESCSAERDPAGDADADRLLGPRTAPEVLHVGSTVPRKRLDVVLDVFKGVTEAIPDARLVRVGGPFTPEQTRQVSALGIRDRVTVLPPLARATLAAVYRRSSVVLLPSEREGFGLPLIEALACGTQVLVSDIEVFREVGGAAASYAPVGDIARWRATALALLAERLAESPAWQERRHAGLARAGQFSWARAARRLADIYAAVASQSAA
jgi:glycosyltransferase involved in cell wall biosynthesis